MHRSIILNTLYVKRWYVVGWMIAIALLTVFTVALFPTFRDAFGTSLTDLPDSTKAILGDTASWTTLSGFVNLQVIEQFVFMTVIMSVILGSTLIAGDESSGKLQSLLAQPVTRSTVYWQKFGTLAVATAFAIIAVFGAVLITNIFLGEPLNIGRFFLASAMMFVITMVFGSLAFALGAITGKKGISGSVVGFIAFAAYLITAMAASINALRVLDRFSPFHYYNKPNILGNGLNLSHTALLLGCIVIMSVLGWIVFKKRDISLP